jgi:hypothetical protein
VLESLRLRGDPGTGIDTVTVVSPTGASTCNGYIPFLRQRGEASAGGCLGTSMASNGLNLAELRAKAYDRAPHCCLVCADQEAGNDASFGLVLR